VVFIFKRESIGVSANSIKLGDSFTHKNTTNQLLKKYRPTRQSIIQITKNFIR
jgi:hypothetical protein